MASTQSVVRPVQLAKRHVRKMTEETAVCANTFFPAAFITTIYTKNRPQPMFT